MKLSGFKIASFAKDEYTASQLPEKQGLNGESLLIRGPNRSGKSLTFNAILYGLLGPDAMIAARPGGGNKVWVTFDDGSRIFRGDPKRKYECESGPYEKDDADEKLDEKLGDTEILEQHFLHSHLDELPLENLKKRERIELVLAVTNLDTKEKAEKLQKELEEIEDKIVEKEDRVSPLEKQKRRSRLQVSQHEGQKEDWQNLDDLVKSGRLAEIEQTLENHTNIREKREELSKKRRGLSRKITSKQNEIEELKRYEQEVEDIIIEAMKEFVCPVCDERVDSQTANKRMDLSKCPFCKQEHSIQDLKDHLHKEKSESEGRPGELKEEIARHEEEIEEIEAEIENLEEELPVLSELNDLAVDKLKEEGKSIKEIKEEAEKKLPTVEENLEEYRNKLKETTENLDTIQDSLEELKEQKKAKKKQLARIQSESYSEEVRKFEEVWTSHFVSMSGELGLEINLHENDGTISLPGGDDDPREYNRRGDLSDSEIQLLNLSFALTLNDFATDADLINWDCLVLDEPFSHLDQGTKESALEYISSVEQQVILTSSDDYVADQFSNSRTLELVRGKLVQTSLGDW